MDERTPTPVLALEEVRVFGDETAQRMQDVLILSFNVMTTALKIFNILDSKISVSGFL